MLKSKPSQGVVQLAGMKNGELFLHFTRGVFGKKVHLTGMISWNKLCPSSVIFFIASIHNVIPL